MRWLLKLKSIKGLEKRLINFYKLRIRKNPLIVSHHQWIKDNGDITLGADYPLTKDSVVFEVGGYKGKWSQRIVELYDPWIYIFEPVREYYEENVKRFKSNPKIFTYNFGLADKNVVEKIAISEDSSSIYKKGKYAQDIQLRDIADFFKDKSVSRIDLIDINIEGGEYPLLQRMIDAGIVEKCQNIKVQFHDFVENAEQKREEILKAFKKTHCLTYSYPFVWESWQKK